LDHPGHLVRVGSKNLRDIEPPEGRGPFNVSQGKPANAVELELGLCGLTGVLEYDIVLTFLCELTGEPFRLALELGS